MGSYSKSTCVPLCIPINSKESIQAEYLCRTFLPSSRYLLSVFFFSACKFSCQGHCFCACQNWVVARNHIQTVQTCGHQESRRSTHCISDVNIVEKLQDHSQAAYLSGWGSLYAGKFLYWSISVQTGLRAQQSVSLKHIPSFSCKVPWHFLSYQSADSGVPYTSRTPRAGRAHGGWNPCSQFNRLLLQWSTTWNFVCSFILSSSEDIFFIFKAFTPKLLVIVSS